MANYNLGKTNDETQQSQVFGDHNIGIELAHQPEIWVCLKTAEMIHA